jgi:two-component system OmpR family sensor kinase
VVALTNPGRGLSEAQLANLFRLYYRTDEARQSKIAGTGLGLYIVRALVEAHGGTVTAASTRGSASQRGEEVTFTVTLPASNS